MKNVLFKFDVDSGKFAGTGHFYRCLKIYSFLRKKYKNKLKYFFLFKDLNGSKKIVKKHLNKNLILYKNNFKNSISFMEKNDLIINDTPKKIDKPFLSFCRKKKISNLVLIDHDKINFSSKYYLINGIFYFKKRIKRSSNVFQGFKYIILDKEYESINKKTSNNLKILISMGGSDNKNLVYKIYNYLKVLSNIKIYVVVGPAFKKNNPILKVRNKNFFLIKNNKNLKPFFEKTDVSITAGGISMFESIASKNITLVTELYENQKYSISKLKELKMINVIGKKNHINSKKLIKIVDYFQKLKKYKKIICPKNFNLIDGKSFFRIQKIFFKVINKNIY
jgi:spore coat polysaccharide biosynthesis predicted glycosyltransferase SpsG